MSTADVICFSITKQIGDEHPPIQNAIEDGGPEVFDFFFKAACVYVALDSLFGIVDEPVWRSVYGVVFADSGPVHNSRNHLRSQLASEHFYQEDHRWHERGETAYRDCDEFVDQAISHLQVDDPEAKWVYAASIGTWVLWNVSDRRPGPDDHGAIKALGTVVCSSFAPFWEGT